MSVIKFNPTNLVDMLRCTEFSPEVKLTGLEDIAAVDLLHIVLENLESVAIRYGHQATVADVYMSSEDIPDYIEELISSIIETTGIEDIEFADEYPDSMEDADSLALDREYRDIVGEPVHMSTMHKVSGVKNRNFSTAFYQSEWDDPSRNLERRSIVAHDLGAGKRLYCTPISDADTDNDTYEEEELEETNAYDVLLDHITDCIKSVLKVVTGSKENIAKNIVDGL